MNILGVIPARGGSKSVPRKNLAVVAGRSLLQHTIDVANTASTIDRVVVSTEDPEIADEAARLGAEVIERPTELAADETRTEPVLIHAVQELATSGYQADVIVTLEPTSPLRSASTINRCVDAVLRGERDAVITVCETTALVGQLSEDGTFTHLIPGLPRRRQERPAVYRETSTVYATRSSLLLERQSLLGDEPFGVVIPPHEAVDINERLDLIIAEALIESQEGERHG